VNKNRKLPREGAAPRDEVDTVAERDTDTEGHRAPAMPRMPGTGGDALPRRPSTGGEVTEDDVEGHAAAPMTPRMPGTGGDAFPRRPSSGGELTDDDYDVEGHVR
jgi:hypothetical protein